MAAHNAAVVGNAGAATLAGSAINVKGWAAILHITSVDTTSIADLYDYHDPAHLALTGSIVGQQITSANAIPSTLAGATPDLSGGLAAVVLTSLGGKTFSFTATLQQIQLGRNNLEGTVTYNFVSYGAVTIA